MRMWGASDDLVEIDGIVLDEKQRKGASGDGRDEIGCYNHDVLITIGSAEGSPGSNGAGVQIKMAYACGRAGVWQASIRPIDEDVPCPWDINVLCEGYTASVFVNVPPGVPVRVQKLKRKS